MPLIDIKVPNIGDFKDVEDYRNTCKKGDNIKKMIH